MTASERSGNLDLGTKDCTASCFRLESMQFVGSGRRREQRGRPLAQEQGVGTEAGRSMSAVCYPGVNESAQILRRIPMLSVGFTDRSFKAIVAWLRCDPEAGCVHYRARSMTKLLCMGLCMLAKERTVRRTHRSPAVWPRQLCGMPTGTALDSWPQGR